MVTYFSLLPSELLELLEKFLNPNTSVSAELLEKARDEYFNLKHYGPKDDGINVYYVKDNCLPEKLNEYPKFLDLQNLDIHLLPVYCLTRNMGLEDFDIFFKIKQTYVYISQVEGSGTLGCCNGISVYFSSSLKRIKQELPQYFPIEEIITLEDLKIISFIKMNT